MLLLLSAVGICGSRYVQKTALRVSSGFALDGFRD